MAIQWFVVEEKNGICGPIVVNNGMHVDVNKILGMATFDFDQWLIYNGLVRHSLSDGAQVLHYVHPAEQEKSCTGFYHQIIEQSHDEIYVCDGDGKTLYCNRVFEKNYGISREIMLGKTPMFLVEQGYVDKTPIPEVLRTKKQVSIEQHTITGRTLFITATPYFASGNTISFIVENCRDITELEAMRTQLAKKSIEADRYKAEAESMKRLGDAEEGVFDTGLAMKRLNEMAQKVAKTEATLLILGESGTGKSHIAQYIHKNSNRVDYPFISINCSTLSHSLFESELFGYVAGAFTGAGSKGKVGLVELAANGTLFLDEIGEVPVALQVKLLELIQEKRFLPVGAIRYKEANVRIIAATNQSLVQLVENKAFREDLYYRLKVVELTMPPLRERSEDVENFIELFMKRFNEEYGFTRVMSPETKKILKNYNWPGNIRELQNLVHNLVIMAPEDEILPADLPATLLMDYAQREDDEELGDLDRMMETYERAIIQRCYQQSKSSYQIAEALNISQSKAHRLIKKHIGVVFKE